MIIKALAAFVGTLFFMVLFNTSKKELLICGLAGSISWISYDLIRTYVVDSEPLSSFVATVIVASLAHFLSKWRKQPVTIYELAGILPLVPGAGMYYSLYYLVIGNQSKSAEILNETLAIAGAIAVGMLLVASLRKMANDRK